jgi:hypothetical protein
MILKLLCKENPSHYLNLNPLLAMPDNNSCEVLRFFLFAMTGVCSIDFPNGYFTTPNDEINNFVVPITKKKYLKSKLPCNPGDRLEPHR